MRKRFFPFFLLNQNAGKNDLAFICSQTMGGKGPETVTMKWTPTRITEGGIESDTEINPSTFSR